MLTLDGNKLKEFRKQKKLRLREVAEKLGTSPQNVSNYESDFSKPPADVLLTLLDLYEVQASDVIKVLS